MITQLCTMTDAIDTLTFRFNQFSSKEIGPVNITELIQDLSKFRDTLPDLASASIRLALAVREDRIAPSFADLLSEVVSRDILQAEKVVTYALSMLELLMLTYDTPQREQLNSIASTAATDLMGDGIMERLNTIRDLARSQV